MSDNTNTRLRFALTSASEDVYYDAAEDITEWFRGLEPCSQQDYMSTIDQMEEGDLIYLADLHLVLQRWAEDDEDEDGDDIPVFGIRTH